MSKWIRSIGVTAATGLLVGALVGGGASPASAAKRCKAFKPGTPISDSPSAVDAKREKVVKITDSATQAKPYTVNYNHGPAAWLLANPEDPAGSSQVAIQEDTKWFNIQVDSKKRFVGLYVRQQWSETSASDMDLYIYDKAGSRVGTSGEFNAAPGTGLGTGDGGPGFEQVLGMGVMDCSGYTIESRAFTTAGEAMTLKVWLGSVR